MLISVLACLQVSVLFVFVEKINRSCSNNRKDDMDDKEIKCYIGSLFGAQVSLDHDSFAKKSIA